MSAPNILCDTKGMTRERWLDCRMHGPKGDIPYTLGGSDIAAIFGVSPWVTPKELWLIKKGRMKVPPKSNELQLELGHLLEPIAARLYELKSKNIVEEDTLLYQHAHYPYALANFDRRIIRKEDGERGILECKSTSHFKADAWKDDGCPLYYELQLRFYLAVADVSFGDFAAIWGNNPDNDFAMPRLIRDPVMEGQIFERCDEFIWSLVHDKEPTMEDIAPKLALESLAKIYGSSQPGLPTIEFPKEYEGDLRRIAELQQQVSDHRKQADKLEKEAEARSVRIAELMMKHEHGVLETTKDKLLIDFVSRKTTRVDVARLKDEKPSIYEEFKKTTESHKVKVSVQAI